jgi:hypothetical protein
VLLLLLFSSTLGADVSVSNTLGDGAAIAISFLFGGENISVNSFQAMAPLTGPEKGVHFLREHISLKNGTICPLLATIQALSRTRVFLPSEKKRKLHCMGRTFTANKPLSLYLGPKQLKFQLGIEPGK